MLCILLLQETHFKASQAVKGTEIFFGGGVGVGAPKSLQMMTAAMKLKDAYSLEEKLWPT